jgi:hypothetical protein
MPTLLSLPRELRDMVIEHVLMTSTINSTFLTHPDHFRYTTRPSDPPIPHPTSPLLLTCQQLRAETLDAISRINVPLVLELIVLENGRVYCSWQGVPWKKVWRRIDMQVNIHVRPTSEYAEGKEKQKIKRLQRERVAKTVRHNVLKALRLYLDINGELVPTEIISTTIARLNIDVRTRLDVGKSSDLSSGGEVKAPRISRQALMIYTAALAPHLSDILFKYNPWPGSEIAHSHERENIAMLSRIKEVGLCCDGNVICGWNFDRLLDATRPDLSKTQIRIRKEAGEERKKLAWDTVEGKRNTIEEERDGDRADWMKRNGAVWGRGMERAGAAVWGW